MLAGATRKEGGGAEGKLGTGVVLGAVSPQSDPKGANSRAERTPQNCRSLRKNMELYSMGTVECGLWVRPREEAEPSGLSRGR